MCKAICHERLATLLPRTNTLKRKQEGKTKSSLLRSGVGTDLKSPHKDSAGTLKIFAIVRTYFFLRIITDNLRRR